MKTLSYGDYYELPPSGPEVTQLIATNNKIDRLDLFQHESVVSMNVSFNPLKVIVGSSRLTSLLASHTQLVQIPRLERLKSLTLSYCGF